MGLDMNMLSESSASSICGTAWNALQTYERSSIARPIGLSQRALRSAITYIEINLGERFTLDTLATAAGVSRFHFARLFRISTGRSPMEFLMRARIERGKQLLKTTEFSICSIAALLGFCDQSHFTRTFRRVTGMAPRDYLRRDQAASELN